MEAESSYKRNHFQQFRTYLGSVKHQWRFLTASGAVVGVAEFLRAQLAPEWTVPPWIRAAAWVAAMAPAQYLAWRDAYEAKGTPEKPFAGKGLQVTGYKDHDTTVCYYDDENPYNPPTPGPPCSFTRIKADAELRGRALEVFCNGDFLLSEVHVYCVNQKNKKDNTTYLPRVVAELASQSFLIDLRGYTPYSPLQLRELLVKITAETLPAVVRVEEIGASRPGRMLSWFKRTKTTVTETVKVPPKRKM